MSIRSILLAGGVLAALSVPALAQKAGTSAVTPGPATGVMIAKPGAPALPQPDKPIQPELGCPAPVQGGEAAADWRPPPIPPKEAHGGGEAAADWRPPPIPPKEAHGGIRPPQGSEAASDWRPPPIPPKVAAGSGMIAPQGGEAAADWRPPPIPPREGGVAGWPACNPAASESADWRPPPIPPKR